MNWPKSEGTDFDRMFLQLMITHHEGAVTMVDELLEQPGSAYDPMLFEFANDVSNDQTAEIERMHALLITLSDDPRAGLAAGFDDAGQALDEHGTRSLAAQAARLLRPRRTRPNCRRSAHGMTMRTGNGAAMPAIRTGTATILKCARSATRMTGVAMARTGVRIDPEESAEDRGDSQDGDDRGDEDDDGGRDNGDGEADKEDEDGDWDRSPLLSFSNTDMAFRDDIMFAGSYHGFNIYRLDDEGGLPQQISSVVCPGGQGDVSVVGDLLDHVGGTDPGAARLRA